MGKGYIIGCNRCFSKNNVPDIWKENDTKGTYFNISTGGGMLCFCKEQLEKRYGINKNYNRKHRLLAMGDPPEELYKQLGSVTDDMTINNIIYENIKNDFEFTENLGNLPYYCEYCKNLTVKFYFQMIKNNNIYIPEYKCINCKNILQLTCPTWEKNQWGSWSERLKQIKFKLNLFDENGIIKIKSKNNKKEMKLDCKECNNNVFILLGSYFYD